MTILLIFCLFFSSCSSKNNKNDYYSKALKSLEANNIEEAKNNILLYMSTYDDSKQETRDDAVILYTSFDFPASLNINLLKPSDCMEGKITLYKSYAQLGQTQNAIDILESRIHGYLPAREYAMLVVNFPTDSAYTISVLKQWNQIIKDEDKPLFLDLILSCIKNENMSENTARSAIEIAESMLSDSFYKNDNKMFANVYKSIALLLDKLYDTYNSSRYWKMVRMLNPDDEDIKGR